MNQEQYGKIWTLLGTTTTYLILNAWLVTQQGKISLPGIHFEKHTDGSTAVLSLIIGGVLFRCLVSTWHWFLNDFPGRTWPSRTPGLAGWDYDPHSPFGKRLQIVALIVFLILPLLGLVHLNLEVYRDPSCERVKGGGCTEIAVGLVDRLTTYRPLDLSGFRYQLGPKGVQYYPFWEDWLLLLWNGYLQICGWSLLWQVLRKDAPPPLEDVETETAQGAPEPDDDADAAAGTESKTDGSQPSTGATGIAPSSSPTASGPSSSSDKGKSSSPGGSSSSVSIE